ncbi:hypothetical protein C8F04DRAFT_1388686 [Mycena alexandri]|uniref:Transmembrane protein n=1 Tax=Mycena alexandri TaxID=1745969 RepID=A0AAD6XE93_9AGAR|nr:hypothetical protein C8F04DRAFT_1388686 [Mycena alexandri]
MLSLGLPSWKPLVFFVLYLFSRSANSAAIVRPAAPTQSLGRPVEARQTSDVPTLLPSAVFMEVELVDTAVTPVPVATVTGTWATTFTGLPSTGLAPKLEEVASAPSFFFGPSGIADLLVGGVTTSFSISVSTLTGTTAVPVTISGIATVSNSVFTTTITEQIPVATITGQSAASKPGRGRKKVVLVTAVTVSSVVVVIFSLVLWVILRRRRRASRRNTELLTARGSEPKDLPTPFDLESLDVGSQSGVNRASWALYINRPDTRQGLTPSSTVSTRQVYISNQVNRAREKVAELEAETSTLLRQSSRPSHHEAGTGNGPVNDLNPSAIYERLERAVQQIEGLNDRIRELERERRSSWALGRSEEAPPGYIE